jgi:hypothetical protein
MADESTNRMGCAEFEGLLAEAVEGRLSPAQDAEFRSHAQVCQTCGPMLAEAIAGFELLHSLEDVEPPQHLVHNLLIATSGVTSSSLTGSRAPFGERLRQWLLPVFTPMLQPRVAGSLAMGFFSLTLILGLAGFKVSDVSRIDLRPSSIREGLSRTYYQTSARVVKYYDSMRVVYELQTKVDDVREKIKPQQTQQPEQEKKERDDKDITRRPRPKPEYEQYSQNESSMNLATLQPASDFRSSTPTRRNA